MLSDPFLNGYVFAWVLAIILVGWFLWKLRPKLRVELTLYSAFFIVIIAVLLILHGVTLHPTLKNTISIPAWNFDYENNFPTKATTILLITVSITAARLTLAPQSIPKRALWLLMALTYFLFALDEFWEIHETFYDLYNNLYPIIVALIVAALLILQHSANRADRMCLHWLLIGLFLSILGAYALDQKEGITIRFPFGLPTLGFDLHSAEEMLELFGTFFVLLGLIGYSHSKIKGWSKQLNFRIYLLSLPVLAFVIFRYIFWLTPFYELKLEAESVHVVIDENAIAIQGYDLPYISNQLYHERSDNLQINTYYRAYRTPQQIFGFSSYLIDPINGSIYSHSNDRNFRPLDQMVLGRTYRLEQILRIDNLPPNRAIWAVLSLWYEDENHEFHNFNISESDQPLLSDREVILTEFVRRKESVPSTFPAIASFDNGFDLRQVDFPNIARIGETIVVGVTWSSANDSSVDTVQFLHFHHETSDTIWNHDQPPLGARLPTRLWYAGLQDQETWRITIPDGITPGRYQLYTGLYRSSDTERIAAYDESGNEFQDAIIPLGTIEILN